MTLREELIHYCNDVINGEIIACIKHKWSCLRFLCDIENEDTDKFPYVFNEAAAERFFDWMRMFKHRKGVLAGQYIDPHITQKFIFGNVYGWIHRDTGYRRFTKVYWQVGRKNVKSQSLSCVASYELMAFGENASEVYCAATKTKQAKIVWSETESMLNNCPDLKGKFKVAYGEIVHIKTESVMVALSQEDKKSGDGFNPQCGIIDEYHAHPTSEMYDIIDSGMGARTQPLILIITTAGFNLDHPCYRVEYNLVSKILNPSIDFDAENYFVMINEMDTDDEGDMVDDVADEKAWLKANPILCSYPEGLKYIRERMRLAQEEPEKMRDFITKNMNIWINQKASGYMQMDKWKLCGASEDNPWPELNRLSTFVGFDLSATIDLTSVGFEIHLPDGRSAVMSHSFMPEDTLKTKTKTDKVPYDLWVKQGWITTTPGAEVDYHFMVKYVADFIKDQGLIEKELCFDRYLATLLMQDLGDEGHTVLAIPQGIQTLGIPTKDFRAKAYDRKIIHNNNPVLTWAISNAVTRKDPNDNIMLDKSKAVQRIDPIAALMNAHVRAMVNEDNTPLYEKRGMRSL